jgi:hypothetical protein
MEMKSSPIIPQQLIQLPLHVKTQKQNCEM